MFSRCWLELVALALASAAVAAPLSIEDAVRQALATGELEARRLGVEEARAQARLVRLRPNPTITYDRQDVFDEGAAPGFVQDLVKVEQSLPGSKLRAARRELGAREVALAEAAVLVARRKREVEVRRAFVRALTAQAEIGAYERAIERAHGLQAVIAGRVSAGESSKYEQARIRLAEVQERDAHDAAAVELARRRAELAAAMGSPLDGESRLVGALVDGAPASLEARVAAALAALDGIERGGGAVPARPEMIELQTRRAVAVAAAGAARAEGRPHLSLGAGYMNFDQTGLPGQAGYNALASVVLPLPERRRAEQDAALARRDAAQAELLASVRRARGEIAGAREALRAAVARLDRLTRAQEGQLEPLVQMSRESYQAGLQSLLELLDAHKLEREFEVQHLKARGAVTEALEDLSVALGGAL